MKPTLLRDILQSAPRADKIILVGNFNVSVGSNCKIWSCLRRYKTGKKCMFLELCTEIQFHIASAQFQHKGDHIKAWMDLLIAHTGLSYKSANAISGWLQCKTVGVTTDLHMPNCICSLSQLVEIVLLWSYQSVWILQNTMPKTLDKRFKLKLKLKFHQLGNLLSDLQCSKRTLGLASVKSRDCFDKKKRPSH